MVHHALRLRTCVTNTLHPHGELDGPGPADIAHAINSYLQQVCKIPA